ncbi:MAG: FAD-dependent oxidoreductase [Hyphomicrobiaceae bacterium]|nr:FAD-dependent oxidoreductase [Hyphomicrobiaceae bacterium]
MRIAIVGSGVAGNAAAWALARAPGQAREVVLYEKDPRAGGHAHTIDIDYDGERVAVDLGFIVYNTLNYPNLVALFDQLGVATKPSSMGFAVSVDGGKREWKGDDRMLSGLIARRRNLISPRFWLMIAEILRFNRLAIRDRARGDIGGMSLGAWLTRHRFKGRFLSDYLLPMGAAIWSMPTDAMLRFPAESFIGFFDNHRLLHFDRPVWRTVDGGSRSYVKRLLDDVAGRLELRLGRAVTQVERDGGSVFVSDASGARERFDHVILAGHSDQMLAVLADPSAAEQATLGAIRYRDNRVYLHRDPALMPKRRAAWAAWNFLARTAPEAGKADAAVSYSMNLLQGIPDRLPLFVSLNPPAPPAPHLTFHSFVTGHPQFDADAIEAQARLGDLQGGRNTWYCGAWAGHGFHEDGLKAGLDVAERLGASIPWRVAGGAKTNAEGAKMGSDGPATDARDDDATAPAMAEAAE